MARRTSTDKFARKGFTAPARFVGYRDVSKDEAGLPLPMDVLPECGRCAMCGESLIHVFSFVDANGIAFDAGINCAKLAGLSDTDRSEALRAQRQAAELAARERSQPGYIARKAARRAADVARMEAAKVELFNKNTAELAALKVEIPKLEARIARTKSVLSGDLGESAGKLDDFMMKMIREQAPVDLAKLESARNRRDFLVGWFEQH